MVCKPSSLLLCVVLLPLVPGLASSIHALISGKNSDEITLPSCGIPKNFYIDADRIVGGRDAAEGEFPWQVSLRYKSAYISPIHMCGGTILNSRWIITAAHCVHERSPKNFEVATGVYKQEENNPIVASYEVSEIICHEDFEPETFNNDIALLRLKDDIAFKRSKGFVNGICLPESNYNATGVGITTGWGATSEDGGASDTLQAVQVPLIPHYVCEALFGGDDVITKAMLCAGELQGGVDSCQGDSGGPLIQRTLQGKSTLIGIVSWGVGCARPGYPGIYTSVVQFIDWISNHVE